MRTGEMNIAISVNSSYVRYAYVMLTSLFMNHQGSRLHIFALQTDLTREDKEYLKGLAERWGQEIEFCVPGMEQYMDMLPTTANWPKEIYYRLLVGEALPAQLRRLLYLDVDIIVNGPLQELYFMDLKDMEIAAADDTMIQGNFSEAQKNLLGEEVRYFNSGVILYDMDKVREKYTFDTYFQTARRADFMLTNPDQDLLNYVHAGRVLYLDNEKYNAFSQTIRYEGELSDVLEQLPPLIHFAGRKPWDYNGVRYDLEKLWWIYARETPFYIELMEEVFWNSFADDSYYTIMALLKENKELKEALEKSMQLCRKLCENH